MNDEHSITLAELATDPQLSVAARESILAAIDEIDRYGQLLDIVRSIAVTSADDADNRLGMIGDCVRDFDKP